MLASLSTPVRSVAWVAGLTAALAACAPDPSTQSGAELFASRCASCHGKAGDGDGPAAAGLNPRPRKLADPAWQATLTADHIQKVVVGGGPAVGKSALMPPQPDLEAHPEALRKLADHVRSLGAAPPR